MSNPGAPSPTQALNIIHELVGKMKLERDHHKNIDGLFTIVQRALEPKAVEPLKTEEPSGK